MNFSSSIYGIFSTLTPREGSGFSKRLTCYIQHDFNSRSSRGERSPFFSTLRGVPSISNHAPAWGATRSISMIIMVVHDFNSRSLPGERFLRLSIRIYQSIFQFLLPAWGATLNQIPIFAHPLISILAPRMGSDGENGDLESI